MMDAARLLPLVGVLLFLVPLLWAPDPASPAPTSRGVIYIFAIWALLILVAAVLSRYLARSEPAGGTDGDGKAE